MWPALVCALAAGAGAWFVPVLIARIPEPEPEPEREGGADPEDRTLFSGDLPPAPPKEPYVDIAARPGLALRSAVGAAISGAGIGAAVGWSGALLFLVPFVPLAVALFVIDLRTTLLPSWLIKPAYPALLVLIGLAARVDRDLSSLERAGWGWLVIGGWFLVFWVVTGGGGWGYGDVRLSGLLGLALGYLGWPELLGGLMLIFLVGAFGAVAVAIGSRSMKARVPYGPYMLIGAWLGVVLGPWLATGMGY